MAGEVNCHVHSTYSFSPYTPAMIAVKAVQAGLQTVGIMDHDSVSGCAEFLEAAKAVGIAGTAGCEIRVNLAGTAVEGRRVNNPDEPNIAYVALHGIPATQFEATAEFLKPIHDARMARCRAEVDELNRILDRRGEMQIDFDRDVAVLSEEKKGGTITERHILHALALKLINEYGQGADLVKHIDNRLGLSVSGCLRDRLLDRANPHYAYDLLGVFKSALVPQFFIHSSPDECTSVYDAVEFGRSINAIPAYAYLGDVGESPTGDKEAQTFEDAFLGELIGELARIGFQAATYMPPRNTKEQLLRLQRLCRIHGLMEISGVDINNSRQSFNCPILLEPEFRHLADAAWALIAHGNLAALDTQLGLFHPKNPRAALPLAERIAFYGDLGRRMDPAQPEQIMELI